MNAQREPIGVMHTQRLRLRLPRADDAMAVSLLMAPDISARLASWPAHLAPAAAAARLTEARIAAATGDALPLVIERRASGEMLGWISASRAEADPGRAILTYWLGKPFHGQGVMREAAPLALAAVFERLDVTEVRAAVQADNWPSRAVLRGLGMDVIGPGRIWCGARGREEACEWWGIHRNALAANQTLAMVQAEAADCPSRLAAQ
jgi:RimJ/RimL family protein N-acetyltransferase